MQELDEKAGIIKYMDKRIQYMETQFNSKNDSKKRKPFNSIQINSVNRNVCSEECTS